MSTADPVLAVRGVSKSFPGVNALRGVDLTVGSGRVHALVGENGAGKSSLAKVMCGLYAPDAGELLVDGEPVRFEDPSDAIAAGIAMVHQEFTLLPDLSVADNIFLGHEPASSGVVRQREMKRRASELLAEVGMGDAPVSDPAGQLSVARQQIVEIAKALALDARVVIMDEPSAVLGGRELERLFEVVERLRTRGVAIIYISHRLDEVEALADDVTVMRDGAVAWSGLAKDTDQGEIVRHMVGRALDRAQAKRETQPGETVLRVDGLMLAGTEPEGISLEVRAGEIVGVAGMMGSGRSRLARALVGLEPTSGGTVEVSGIELGRRSPRRAARRGLVLVPEDRRRAGLVLDFSLEDNVSLPVLEQVSRLRVVLERAKRALAEHSIEELSIRAAGPEQRAVQLSGGNQQKVVIGKWLATKPAVLLLDEPLRGVDVGAKAEIHALIRSLAEDGAGILLISSELPELLSLTDRIVVMRDGRLVDELPTGRATEERLVGVAVGEAGS